MLNKLKRKTREKIRSVMISFLHVDMLTDLLMEYQDVVNERLLSLEAKSDLHGRIINKHDEKIHSIHNTLSSVVSIGSDIDYHKSSGSSWAVVCIEGNYNVVKFIDLNGKDADEVLNFLKYFEVSRYVHDTPPVLKQLSEKWFTNWNK